MVDTEWRMLRIPELESGILALRYHELAHEFDDIGDLAARRSAKGYLTYIGKLNNLQTLYTKAVQARTNQEWEPQKLWL